MPVKKNKYVISTNKSLLQVDVIHGFLSNCYWAKDIPKSIVKKTLKNSLCFGVYDHGRQVGFARIVSDYATFAYLADVFILEEYRGQGLSKQLMKTIIGHPKLQGLRRWMLATRDAHGLYKQFGFEAVKNTDRLMEITDLDIYRKMKK